MQKIIRHSFRYRLRSGQQCTFADSAILVAIGFIGSDSELELCQKIQNLLFPSGILWDKEIGNYRTIDENYALNIIRNISISYENKKEGELENSPSKIKLCPE